ncbi:hypothetical protein FSP39_019741 [Pinctada imbricata]|uniref:Ribosome biogenesis regulatory protein n=1 Tax=Pinctada imbricata TaxID=66713 RepID=A0AA88Y032_PINIB|nr:hypothetical protein FSP39_019741 [Pinctada imbricata]
MVDLVQRVLAEVESKEAKYKTIEVEKSIDLEIDEGNLLAVDQNPLNVKTLKSDRERYFQELARDNTQLLINRIWQLPTEKVDGTIVVKVPKPKPPSRWELYARLKGIQKRKKGRMVWDDQKKEYRPRWGYDRANDDTKDWLIEIPQNADPNVDYFEKRKKEKKERIAKNELQRLRNIARSQKSKVPGVGLTPTEMPSKEHLGKALAVANKSTASLGKFTQKLPKEKPSKFTGKKRKFEPNYGDLKSESSKQLEILDSIQRRVPVIDTVKAANISIMQDQQSK